MRSKLVTISFKVPLEDYEDYKANLRVLGIYHHSEDLKNYVLGFNKSFGVDVLLKRNAEKIERLQKENKNLIKIKKEKLDTLTNQAFMEVKNYAVQFDVSDGEISLPGSAGIIKEIAKINARTNVDTPTLIGMLESNINSFKDETIKEELLLDVQNIREKYHIEKVELEA
jgi:hypothetical protein